MKSLSIFAAVSLICFAGALVAWRTVGVRREERREERRESAERIMPQSASSRRSLDLPGRTIAGTPGTGDALKRDEIPVCVEEKETEGLERMPARSERATNSPEPFGPSRKGIARLHPHDTPHRSSELEVQQAAKVEREGTVKLPLFYSLGAAEISKRIPQLPEETIKSLQTDFEQQAGVGSLEPEDPEYARRWREAELTLEQQIRLWGGWAAWGAYEHQRAVVAYQQRKASGSTGQ